MKKIRNFIVSAIVSMSVFLNLAVLNASAYGDVAGAIAATWNAAKGQIKSVVDNVVFPVIDVVLVVLLFAKLGTMYMEYKKHGQLEWTAPAVIFGCLIFTLTAPLFIWSIVNI